MKKLSYMAIGIIAGLIIGLTSTAYAEQVKATFSKFNFTVNGQDKKLDADPLVYQGTTYLPVKVIANMLGYDVTYKADDKTILLDNPSAIGSTSGNPIGGSDMTVTPIAQMTINQVDSLIHDTKSEIKDYEISLDDRSGFNELEKDGFRTKKVEAEAKLAELEKRKATLEAQPTPTP